MFFKKFLFIVAHPFPFVSLQERKFTIWTFGVIHLWGEWLIFPHFTNC